MPHPSHAPRTPERRAVIVGGGLVGSLAACYLAKRGWRVDLYEKRPDSRKPDNRDSAEHRSINLAISERGLSALRRLDPALEARVKDLVIPMYGRMIHALDGQQTSHRYDVFGKHINSIGRGALIQLLLDEADRCPGVALHFGHEFVQADFDSGQAVFRDAARGGEHVTVGADLIVGADGAFSQVRQRMMAKGMMNYSQTYIEHGYCEFSMPPRRGDFALDPNHLHIWPRGSFMLIALPNPDWTFTCTLFMPWDKFGALAADGDIVSFFRTHFPDALQLMGEDRVHAEYTANPKGSLMYLKCSPHTHSHRAVLLGDAAHAMVPFYGQGMNCGFEDVEALDRIMIRILRAGGDLGSSTAALTDKQLRQALDEYSAARAEDTSAIVDLALDNYVEMRAKVADYAYVTRKYLEGLLHWLFPRQIIPLYTMVSFTSIPYTQVVARWNRQTLWLHRSITAAAIAAAVGGGVLLARLLGGPPALLRAVARVGARAP
ncbi:kynurenine 3-monooxygenase, mitochondrial precursor [Coemansia nantahalensis]|uniref:Kynurenine 3-monooxygenase, mitochondrial n=2 Tax=Coemansia TaxID=4863 RepID=A0ACC1LEU5_9FUNG|nr:kynurenine 3-monooxygenase, mitochondrial precursor [Coemansia nantahalensis]KAJ2774010.1 kynurenine 3-monooxygenase, mitochondrial precursor [Coemansia nantahalensis]KAJ2806751.1 kynurenine 3-monooxygenase, mitochondrial precursor [Coemansia helicoidea]